MATHEAVPNPQPWAVPLAREDSLYSGVLLAVFALALSLIFGAGTTIAPAVAALTAPALPPTQPGASHDEGWFLFTPADDGSTAIYFIAGNTRHSITQSDARLELQVNPLWPVRQATQDEVLAIPEGAPVAGAKTGLVGASAPADDATVEPAPVNDSSAEPASPAAEPVPAPTDGGAPVTYVLQRGDNLTHIAAQYGTSVDAILAANGISNPNRIYAGQALIIPSGDAPVVAEDAPVAEAPVAQADTVDTTATADAAQPTDTVEASTSYTVAPGDSAIKIARRFGIDEGTLLEANNISNPNRVYVGQVLTIPGA
jgi:LysM repeat protein